MSNFNNYTHIIGLDNGIGATGIALLGPDNLVKYEKLPIKKELNYQKEEQYISRLDTNLFKKLLLNWNLPINSTLLIIEKPMINPTRFKASISASRCWEATLIVLEDLNLNYEIISSKQWQEILLPTIIGNEALKKASLEKGKKLYPNLALKKDADSLLIAHWAKHKDEPKKKKEL